VGICDEFFADALALEGLVDGEVGEVGAVMEVRDCARDADEEAVAGSGGDEDIGVFEHPSDGFGFIDGSAETKGGSSQAVEKFFGGEIEFILVVKHCGRRLFKACRTRGVRIKRTETNLWELVV
jgi:hypothetical protein